MSYTGWAIGKVVDRTDLTVLLHISDGNKNVQVGLTPQEARRIAKGLIDEANLSDPEGDAKHDPR